MRTLFVVALLSILTITASAQRTAPFAGGVKLQQAGGTNPAFGLTMKAKNTVPYSADVQLSWTQPTGNGILHVSNFGSNAGDVTISAIDLASGDVTGILPIANGGTGSATQNFVDLTTNQTVNGAKTFTNAIITGGSVNGTPIGATGASSGAFTTLSATTSETFSNLNSAGVVHNNASGVLSTGPVVLTSAAEVSGVLPIANGGTNGTAVPVAGAIAYGTASSYAFTAAGTTGMTLHSTGAGTPSWATINLADPAEVGTSVLPVANGGTNSSTALNNNRIMVSSAGKIVESAALIDLQVISGTTVGGVPTVRTLTAGTGITITQGASDITIAANNSGVAKKQIALVTGQTNYTAQTPPAGFTIAATSVINITVYDTGGNFTFTATVTDVNAGANTFAFELSGFPTTGFALCSFFN